MLTTIGTDELRSLVSFREGEKKSGEVMRVFSSASGWETELRDPSIRYVLLGIPEDIGPRANKGFAGSSMMWKLFLSKIVNVQSNRFFDWTRVLLAGTIEVGDLMSQSAKLNPSVENELSELRKLTSAIDERVIAVTKSIVGAGKIPVIVGGGHNNSFGLLKGTSLALKKSINCLNIDPHADIRALEGRHSGNGFSYALSDGSLDKYSVVGLHENYNSAAILKQFDEEKNLHFITYDKFLRSNRSIEEIVEESLEFVRDKFCGFEIDLDSIAGFPSSAASPSGFSIDETRRMILWLGERMPLKYAHFSEGAPGLSSQPELWAKGLCYLVTDLLKSCERNKNLD
jgi:formiminoglutamase